MTQLKLLKRWSKILSNNDQATRHWRSLWLHRVDRFCSEHTLRTITVHCSCVVDAIKQEVLAHPPVPSYSEPPNAHTGSTTVSHPAFNLYSIRYHLLLLCRPGTGPSDLVQESDSQPRLPPSAVKPRNKGPLPPCAQGRAVATGVPFPLPFRPSARQPAAKPHSCSGYGQTRLFGEEFSCVGFSFKWGFQLSAQPSWLHHEGERSGLHGSVYPKHPPPYPCQRSLQLHQGLSITNMTQSPLKAPDCHWPENPELLKWSVVSASQRYFLKRVGENETICFHFHLFNYTFISISVNGSAVRLQFMVM